MIYLHCGWPKTGTTSLQAAIGRNRERLAAAGIAYPGRWGRRGDDSHNGLADILDAAPDSDEPFAAVTELLVEHTGEDVLLSSESLTTWVLRDEMCEVLIAFIRAAQRVDSLTCIWTLRRIDDFAHSQCVHMLLAGIDLGKPPAEFLAGLRQVRMFSNMKKVEEAVGGKAVYIKYDVGGAHNTELLRAFGMPEDVAQRIDAESAESPRLNPTRSQKQLVAAIHAEHLSTRAAVTLDKQELLAAFDRGDLRFDDDRPCELAGRRLRLEMHERALEAAQECGFEPYLRFFADERLGDFPPPVSLASDALGEDDLSRLVGGGV